MHQTIFNRFWAGFRPAEYEGGIGLASCNTYGRKPAEVDE
jgi:hypothetical protein